ncbi:MAG TPA: endonuclease/exonuclease/phosphatase family protein [Solirubrobacteraceae bacterium]
MLTFNIGAAAPERAAAILRWLRSRGEDVIVLTETSAGAGTRLLAEGLAANGFDVLHTSHPRERGVLLASRLANTRVRTVSLDVTLPCRAAGATFELDGGALTLIGVYVPSRDRSEAKVARKQAFVSSLLKELGKLPLRARERLVLAGDYNAVARGHEPPLPGFFPWEYALHDELERIGLRPAHELSGATAHPHSWIGRTGIGYLYDYVHLGRALHGSLGRCDYLHGPRERRLSDHAAVSVSLHLT